MNAEQAREIVRMVLTARSAQESSEQITARLREREIPAAEIPALLETLNHGYRQGIQVALKQASSDDLSFGENAVFDEAYRAGYQEFSRSQRGPGCLSLITSLALICAGGLAVLLWVN